MTFMLDTDTCIRYLNNRNAGVVQRHEAVDSPRRLVHTACRRASASRTRGTTSVA
jgi:hypothetical protein